MPSKLEGSTQAAKACAILAVVDREKDMIASLALLKTAGKVLRPGGPEAADALFRCFDGLKFGPYLSALVECGYLSFDSLATWLTGMDGGVLADNAWVWPDVQHAMSVRCRVGDNVSFDDDTDDEDSDAEGDVMKDDPLAVARKDVEEGILTILEKANGEMEEGSREAVALRCGACEVLRRAMQWGIVGEEFGGDIEGVRKEYF